MNIALPTQAIKEYQELIKKHFGEDITFEEAQIRAGEFMSFFRAIHQPIKKKWLADHEKKQNK